MAVDAVSLAEDGVFAGRMFESALACAELMAGFLGLELGLYEALAGYPATSHELARRAGVHERYAREWLEQQAVSGVLLVEDCAKPAGTRVFRLPEAHAQPLLDRTSPYYIAPLALRPVGLMAGMLTKLAEAMRTGAGIAAAEFSGFHGGGLNDSLYQHELPGWIRDHLPDIHRRLLAEPGTRIADVACGTGKSTMVLASTYPQSLVDGFDIDAAALQGRLDNERVRFAAVDITRLSVEAGYDLICLFDSLHDMPNPVAALSACRRLLRSGGCALLLEPKANVHFTAPADAVERFLYTSSLLHCLPLGMAGLPSAACGAVLRPATMRGYAAQAGFSAMHVLAGGSRFHRLYRLNP